MATQRTVKRERGRQNIKN